VVNILKRETNITMLLLQACEVWQEWCFEYRAIKGRTRPGSTIPATVKRRLRRVENAPSLPRSQRTFARLRRRDHSSMTDNDSRHCGHRELLTLQAKSALPSLTKNDREVSSQRALLTRSQSRLLRCACLGTFFIARTVRSRCFGHSAPSRLRRKVRSSMTI
jgi:hypothetical protein